MKKRRADKKTFSVLVEKDLLERFEDKLKEEHKSKTAWLNEKISEELKK